MSLPAPGNLPTARSYTYVKARDEITETSRTAKGAATVAALRAEGSLHHLLPAKERPPAHARPWVGARYRTPTVTSRVAGQWFSVTSYVVLSPCCWV